MIKAKDLQAAIDAVGDEIDYDVDDRGFFVVFTDYREPIAWAFCKRFYKGNCQNVDLVITVRIDSRGYPYCDAYLNGAKWQRIKLPRAATFPERYVAMLREMDLRIQFELVETGYGLED